MKNRTNIRKTYKQKLYKGGAVLEQLLPLDGNTDEIKIAIIAANNAITTANNAIKPNMTDNETEQAHQLRDVALKLIEQVDDLRTPHHPVAFVRQHRRYVGGYYKRKTNKRRRTKRRYLRF